MSIEYVAMWGEKF